MTTLERLAQLEAAATPGPWGVSRADMTRLLTDYGGYIGVTRRLDAKAPADAALIAELRNAAPKLLAVAEAARKYVAYWDKRRADWESGDDARIFSASLNDDDGDDALRTALEALDE